MVLKQKMEDLEKEKDNNGKLARQLIDFKSLQEKLSILNQELER
jgi:hypothetical protein